MRKTLPKIREKFGFSYKCACRWIPQYVNQDMRHGKFDIITYDEHRNISGFRIAQRIDKIMIPTLVISNKYTLLHQRQ